MTGAGPRKCPCTRIDAHDRTRDQFVASRCQDVAVRLCEQRCGVMFTSRESRQPESNPSHRSSGVDAVPGDVTDEQQDVVAVDENVVPVTAYLARPGLRVVSGSDIQQ